MTIEAPEPRIGEGAGEHVSPVMDEVHGSRADVRAYTDAIQAMAPRSTSAELFMPPADQVLATEQPAAISPQQARELTERAFAAMNSNYGDYPHHTWASITPSPMFTTAWPLGQQIEATIAAGKLNNSSLDVPRELAQRLDGLHYYWTEQNGVGGYDAGVNSPFSDHDRYYDDNAWIALGLMDVYQGNSTQSWALDKAKKLFELEQRGAEEAAKVTVEPGGVMWKEGDDKGYRGTVSTAGATQVALRLYESTQDPKYLEFAEKQFDWVDQHLSNGSGLYIDGINGKGEKDGAIYSYNQGLMLGDATLLYKLTGDQKYLDKAQDIADAATKYFTEEKLESQSPIFNAIFFKNLQMFDNMVPNAASGQHNQMIERYAGFLQSHMDENGVVLTGHEQDEAWKSLTQSASIQIFSMLA